MQAISAACCAGTGSQHSIRCVPTQDCVRLSWAPLATLPEYREGKE